MPMKYLDPEQPLKDMEYEVGEDENSPDYLLIWHLPTVAERMQRDTEMMKYIHQQDGDTPQGFETTFSVAMHIDDVLQPGVEEGGEGASLIGPSVGLARRQKIREFVMKQGAIFAQQFLVDIEDFSCGVETSKEYQCRMPRCGHLFERELPVEEGFFFLTKASLRKRAKQRKQSRVKTPWKKKSDSLLKVVQSENEPVSASTKDQSSPSSTASSLDPHSLPRSPLP